MHIRAALGRVLAEDVISPLDVPAHDNSAMDGYAVRFADLKSDGKVTLKVAGTAFAGAPFKGAVKAGECVRIMTGGVVPQGADTIVMQEHVEAKGDAVTIGGGHRQGQNLRHAGEDLQTGQAALKRGQVVRPAEIGLIASLGIPRSRGLSPPARRVFLDRRRTEIDRHRARAKARSTTATATRFTAC